MNVTTVDGPVDLKIPEGTQPGTTLLLGKRGAPSPMKRTNERGDHLIKVKVRCCLAEFCCFVLVPWMGDLVALLGRFLGSCRDICGLFYVLDRNFPISAVGARALRSLV